MGKFEDLTGKRYTRLLVIRRMPNDSRGRTRWLCRCDCGKEITAYAYSLKSGHTKSCGCYSHDLFVKNNTKHNAKHSRLYDIWCHMKERCYYPPYEHYDRYGGRGIKVCNEWEQDFSAFQTWALANGYSEHLTIDRINNDGNYEPANCRWISIQRQERNRCDTVFVLFRGQKMSLHDATDALNINYKSAWQRYRDGEKIADGIRPILSFKEKHMEALHGE